MAAGLIWIRSARCATDGCRCIRSALAKEQAAHDVEMDEVSVASRAMADSRMKATVSFRQRGYAGGKTVLAVRDGDKLLASKDVTLGADGVIQTETVFFNAGTAGVKRVQFSLEPLAGEENVANNAMTRLVGVSGDKRRILYVEGEPRWEYKFIRRAAEDDHGVQVVSMLRTTENKIYRQGISDPNGAGGWISGEGGRSVPVPRNHHRVGGGWLLYPKAAGVAAGVCRQARRWAALSWRPVCVGGWRMGRVESDRVVADLSAEREEHVSSRSGDGAADGSGCGQSR